MTRAAMIAAAVAFGVVMALRGGFADFALLAASGAALAIAGLALLYLSVFFDPHPGESRCPKCTYPLAPDARLCPECGHRPRNAHELVRRPRRWGLAALALVLMLGAPGGFFAQRALRDGFWRAWPSWAIVSVLPIASSNAWEEIEGRLTDPSRDLTAWERRLLCRRCVRTVVASSDTGIRLIALDILLYTDPNTKEAVEAFRVAMRDEEPVLASWAFSHARGDWLARELADVIEDPTIDVWRRTDAIWTARQAHLKDPRLLEVILKALNDPNPPVREAAAQALEDLQQAFFSPRRDRWSPGLGRPLNDTTPPGGGGLSRPMFEVETDPAP